MDTTGEDGYELWLRYRTVDNPGQLAQYYNAIHSATVLGNSATADIIRRELARALPVLVDCAVPMPEQVPATNALVVGGEPHIHVALSTPDGAFGRHLEPGCIAYVLCEVFFAEVEGVPLSRQRVPVSVEGMGEGKISRLTFG
jgi:hypothetical protein